MLAKGFSARGAVLAAALALAALAPQRAWAETPESVVDGFHRELLGIMKDAKDLKVSGRYQKFLGLIDRYFHMPLMVAFVTGDHWTKASESARNAAITAARRLSAAELAVLFDGYSGESFKTTKVQTIQDKSVLVETDLVRTSDGNVKVTYRTRRFGENWRIIDVLLDGSISQLLKRREEYARTLADGGLDGLSRLLNSKADEISQSRQAAN